MASDFLKVLREIRGTGAPEAAYTDGIYYDLTIALTGAGNAPGKYGHMVEMYNNLTGPTGSYTDFVVKYNAFLIEYADVLAKANVADQAAIDAVAAKVATELLKTNVEGLVTTATTASNNVNTRLNTVQLNGSTVEANLNAVGNNSININTVSNIAGDVTTVASGAAKVTAVADSIVGVNTVSGAISKVNAVADSIDSVDSVSLHLNAIDITASMQDEVNRLAISPAYPAILSAEDNAFKSEREAWEAEAQRYTANSYANEAPNIFVKLWSSIGDGTFTYINSTEYSSRHYASLSNGLYKLIGFFDASTATGVPTEGDSGGYLQVSVAGDVSGTVIPPLAVYDELRWNTVTEQYDIYRKTIPFANLLDVPENVSNAQSRSEKGWADGYAPLDSNALIPSEHLPSYVDDVIEVATYVALPITGETGKIYVVVADETSGGDTSTYRWTGTTYAMVSNTLTATDVKSMYESNLDTNAFTDAEKTKLASTEISSQLDLRDIANRDRANHTGTQPIDTVTETVALKILTATERSKLTAIEEGATADQTAAEIETLYEGLVNTNKYTDAEKTHVGVATILNTVATTLPTAINEVHGDIDSVVAGTTAITYNGTISGLTATTVKTAIDEVDGRVDVTESTIADVNLTRADKYLAAQNIANMVYTGEDLTKIQYNTATDVDYEVFTYSVDGLTNIAHYTDSILRGNTVLTYTAGDLTSAVFTGV